MKRTCPNSSANSRREAGWRCRCPTIWTHRHIASCARWPRTAHGRRSWPVRRPRARHCPASIGTTHCCNRCARRWICGEPPTITRLPAARRRTAGRRGARRLSRTLYRGDRGCLSESGRWRCFAAVPAIVHGGDSLRMTPMPSIESVPVELRDCVERWWERACARPGFLDVYQALTTQHRAQLPRVVAASEFVAGALIQDPKSLEWFAGHDAGTSYEVNAGYEAMVGSASTLDQAESILREWRRRAMSRIAWRDISGIATVTETLLAVSDLADAAVRAAAAAAARHLEPIFGKPRCSKESSPFII